MKRLMTGLEALARGAAEKRVELVVVHATRALEPLVAAAEREGLELERAPSEAVALQVAAGASLAGARVVVAVESLEGAAETLHAESYVGAAGGLAVVVVDDPGLALSPLERDSRVLARALSLPVLEPADPVECLHHVAAALGLAERWSLPVVLRLTTRLALDARPVPLRAPEAGMAAGLRRDREGQVLTPEHAARLRARVAERLAQLATYAVETPLNRLEWRSRELGVVTSGVAYHHVREVLPEASILKLGLSFPLPTALVRELAAGVARVVVVEEVEPVLESDLRQLGIACRGKDLLPRSGELGPDLLARALGQAPPRARPSIPVPGRPPELCAGCPQRALLQALKRLHVNVVAEPGCAASGSRPPLSVVDGALAPGSAAAVAHGAEAVLGDRVRGRILAVLGADAFLHSGALALAHAARAGGGGTLILTEDGAAERRGLDGVDLPAAARALGAARVRTVDPFDLPATEAALREELARPELSVVVARAPCRTGLEGSRAACAVEPERCNRCGACLRLGCPAISDGLDTMVIDPGVCAGCGLCLHVCRARAVVRLEEAPCPRA